MNHSQKTKAGIKLTKILKEILNEETEFIEHPDLGDVMITKGEFMLRQMTALALGKEYEDPDTGEIKRRPPDTKMMALIFDRVDGRAVPVVAEKSGLSVSERIDEQSRKRISDAGNRCSEPKTDS